MYDLVLLLLLTIFLAPFVLGYLLFRSVRVRHEETLAALATLTQTVRELRRDLRIQPFDVGPPTRVTAEARPSVAQPEEAGEVRAGSREAEPVGVELVDAVALSGAPEVSSPGSSAATQVAAGVVPASPTDAATVDTLKRIWNWFLFGQEQAPTSTSIEIAIGANWLLRIGMLVLIVGIAFFLKYSIDRGWIGPFERVMLGTATGFAMVTIGSMLLAGRYRLLAHGIQGGGIVTLYLSVFAAAVFLKLIDPVPVGFLLMACVTVLACLLALIFGSPLTAVIGIVGGYLTPVLLPSDGVQFVTLYTYLALLGLGVLGISVRKNWPQLNVLSFVGTYALLASSIAIAYSADLYWVILSFLVFFFLLFSTVVFLSSRRRGRADLFDLAMLWLNALFFFGLSITITRRWLDAGEYTWRWTALIPLGIAGCYGCHTYLLLLRRSKDAVLFHASLGLAAVFLAVAVPIVLSQEWITFGWAVQALVMLWLSLRMGSQMLRVAAVILFAITILRFFAFDAISYEMFIRAWQGVLLDDVGRFLPRLTALGGSILCVAWGARLLSQSSPTTDSTSQAIAAERNLPREDVTLAVTAAVMLFLYGSHEIYAGVSAYLQGLQSGAVSIWWSVYAIALIAFGMWKSLRWVRTAGLLLFAVVTCKVFFIDLSELGAIYRIVAFVILGLIIMSGAVLYLRFKTDADSDKSNPRGPIS